MRDLRERLLLKPQGTLTGFVYPEFLLSMGRNWAGLKPSAYLPNDLYFWLQFVTGPHGKGFELDTKVKLLE